MEDIIQNTEEKMMLSIEALENKFANVRAGRANPSMLDGVMVEYYGVPTPLKSLANISVPEARQLSIKPFDKSCLGSIEKAIFDGGTIHTPTGKTGKEWNYKIYKGTTGQAIAQPKPGNFGAVFKEKCYGTVPGGLESGELIHKGGPFFVGNKTNGCYCSVKKKLLEEGKNPLTHPSDFKGIFGEKIMDGSNSNSEVLFDPGVQAESPELCMSSGKSPAGSACRMYAQQGPREIMEFMCDEMSNEEAEEKAKQASIENPNDVYYVAYDDIMNPRSDISWYRGNQYTIEDIMNKRHLQESINFDGFKNNEELQKYFQKQNSF